jgi:hypothetical protein
VSRLPQWAVPVLMLLVASPPGLAAGQSTVEPFRPWRNDSHAVHTWVGEVAYLGGNAILGGVTAGVMRELRGGSFWEAFRVGAVGGSVSYAGKRIAAESFVGAGLLGREVAALGSSIAHNAADGRTALAEIVLPVGFARLYLRRDSASLLGVAAAAKLDLATLIAAGYLGFTADEFDLGASLSTGTPVFVVRERMSEQDWTGLQVAGVIRLTGDPPAGSASGTTFPQALAHETVHVLQYDFALLVWSDPAEQWLTARLPGGSWIDRHVHLGLVLPGWALANAVLPYTARPWEQEAHFLTRWEANRD